MTKRLGGDCKIYRNTASYATPTWNEITNVEDLSLPMSRSQGEFKVRGSKFVLKKNSKIDLGVEFKLVVDKSDDDYSVLRDAFLAEPATVIEFAIMDEAIATTGANGLRASFEVAEFPLDEPLEGELSAAVKLTPAISANAPAWLTV